MEDQSERYAVGGQEDSMKSKYCAWCTYKIRWYHFHEVRGLYDYHYSCVDKMLSYRIATLSDKLWESIR